MRMWSLIGMTIEPRWDLAGVIGNGLIPSANAIAATRLALKAH